MWKDTLALDYKKSLQIWKALVTKRRGEYSQRLKLARLTSESESSSSPWPTPSQRDYKGACESRITPEGYNSRLDEAVIVFGPPAQANHNTHGSHPESWLTPRANEPAADANFVERNADRSKDCHPSLTMQVQSWATPRAGCPGSRAPGTGGKVLEEQVKEPKAWATPRAEMDSGAHKGKPDTLHSQMKAQSTGKLNPRWVETLMGLPVGWTMPSCASPVTIGQTNCGYSETE